MYLNIYFVPEMLVLLKKNVVFFNNDKEIIGMQTAEVSTLLWKKKSCNFFNEFFYSFFKIQMNRNGSPFGF